jgi:murein DD-endopeptidase MepM/ murein hydrolase activator NlpD
MDPFGSGKIKWHNGIDIAVKPNEPVTPTDPGLVRFSGWHRDYGWLVVVDHHNGWFTMYGHNSALAVKAGQEVTTETVIAYAGSTGRSTGVHVHYEKRWYPEGTIQAAGVRETDGLEEYHGRRIHEPLDSANQPVQELRQSGQDFQQDFGQSGEPELQGYSPGNNQGVGGD